MHNVNLKGKKILLLAPSFYNYYVNISDELKKMGAEVELILEVHDPMYLYFYRKNKYIRERYTYSYYSSRINKIQNIDYIFLIRGEAINSRIMELLISKFPNAKRMMYQWDSVKNNPNIMEIVKYFNKCYTFDSYDAEKFNWIYRPLFYLEENKTKENIELTYDFVFIATLYYKRAMLLKKLKKFCNINGYKLFNLLFVKKIEYFVHAFLLKDSRYTEISNKDVSFVSLSAEEVNNIYKNSKIFVDYTAETQTGLTIRTIESVGCHKKIITNNKRIMEADFYNPDNVFVYDFDNFNVPKEFINSEYKELDAEIYRKYSLYGWLSDIFMEETKVD